MTTMTTTTTTTRAAVRAAEDSARACAENLGFSAPEARAVAGAYASAAHAARRAERVGSKARRRIWRKRAKRAAAAAQTWAAWTWERGADPARVLPHRPYRGDRRAHVERPVWA